MQRDLKFHFFESVSSTQDIAKKLVKDSQKIHVIIAETQTQGKGTFGKPWISPPHSGLYLTMAFQTSSSCFFPTLSQLASVCLCQTLEDIHPQIKWPNDVLVAGKKIAGILSEIDDTSAYVGIGLNISASRDFNLIDQPFTTMSNHRKHIDKLALLKQLSQTFSQHLSHWEQVGFKSIKSEYKKFFTLLQHDVMIETKEGLLKGKLVDFSDEGYPMLQSASDVHTITHPLHIHPL